MMNKVLKISLLVLGINMLFIVMLVVTQNTMDSFVSIGLFWLFSLVVQLIVGLILVLQQRHRESGKGVLLGVLLGLVIGFSVCSTVIR